MSGDSTVIPLRQPEAIAIPLMEAARAEAHRMLAPVLIAKAGAFMARWKDFSCRMVAIAGLLCVEGRHSRFGGGSHTETKEQDARWGSTGCGPRGRGECWTQARTEWMV
jgi:hypothetical protein